MVTKSVPLALVLCVASFVRPAAGSITLLDTQGFEAPLFSTTFNPGGGYDGQLEGQPTAPPEETWQQSGPDSSTATVHTGVVLTGTQAVELFHGGGDTRWGVPIDFANPLSVTVSFDMLVRGPAGDVDSELGPLMGVEAYGDSAGGLTLLGSIFVDGTSGEVLYQDTGTGLLVPALGPDLSFLNVWNSFDLVLDFAAQGYSILVNNVLAVGGIGFVDGVDGLFSSFGSADLAALDAGFGVTGFAFVDNFVITAVVPEFSTGVTWMVLAVAASGGFWLKRRRATAA